MARRNQVMIAGGVIVVVATLAMWVADAERRADWPDAARELARAIDDASAVDARLETMRLVGDYVTAARWAEQERYAAAEAMAAPLVEVGEFRVTAYLVPRDGGPLDCGGMPLHHGVVATDPAVIPTGALIYIPALREFDRLYAPVYRIPLREAQKNKDDVDADTDVGTGDVGLVDDDIDGGVEGGYAVSYDARGGGWFVARDTGAKVRGHTIDVAVFSDDAYRYIAEGRYSSAAIDGADGATVRVYRMRYSREWMKTGDYEYEGN